MVLNYYLHMGHVFLIFINKRDTFDQLRIHLKQNLCLHESIDP